MSVQRNMRLALAALLVAASTASVRAQQDRSALTATASEVISAAVAAKVDVKIGEEEKKRLKLVEDAIASGGSGGAWRAVAGRKAKYLTLRDVALLALEKNLTLQVSRQDPTIADLVLQEAEVVFYPTLSLSIDYADDKKFNRTFFGKVEIKSLNGTTLSIPTGGKSPAVDLIQLATVARETATRRLLTASKKKTFSDPGAQLNYSVGVSQQLPWGSTVALTATQTYQKIFYHQDHYFESGAFSTDVDFDLTVPVPGTKGFGENAPAEIAVRLSEKGKKRTEWEVKEAVNSILSRAEIGYWTLVRRLEELHIEVENRRLVADQADRVARRFELRRATTYQKAQADSELAKAEVRVEGARNNFLAASNTLAEQLTDEAANINGQVILPYGYRDRLGDWLQASGKDALATARKHRPLLLAARVAREQAEISLRGARNAAKPDVSISVHADLDQNGTKYGYGDVWETIREVKNPDTTGLNGALTFTRPWGNRGLEASAASAAFSASSQSLSVREVEQQLTREIGDVIISLASARSRANLATSERTQATSVIRNLERRFEVGADVVQNEVVLSTRRLLDAERGLLSALIENKQGEVHLLASQGTLANEFGIRNAVNTFDEHRLKVLNDSGVLRFFRSIRRLFGGADGPEQARKVE